MINNVAYTCNITFLPIDRAPFGRHCIVVRVVHGRYPCREVEESDYLEYSITSSPIFCENM